MKRKEVSPDKIYRILRRVRIKLDCGHYASIGHNFSNTAIVYPSGKMVCHNCGY